MLLAFIIATFYKSNIILLYKSNIPKESANYKNKLILNMLLGILINVSLLTLIIWAISNEIKVNLLSFQCIFFLLIVKIIAGCLYGIMYSKSVTTSDTWRYHELGLQQYELLKRSFYDFAIDLFNLNYKNKQIDTFFESEQSYWKDLPVNIIIKLLAIFNTFSKGNYYVNAVMYNLCTLFGNIWLFKALNLFFSKNRRVIFTLVCLFPPLIFWTSGIHKDGIVFTSIAAILYFTSKCIITQINLTNLFGVLTAFIVLFLFRNFVALSMFPLLLAYILANKRKMYAIRIYMVTIAGGVLLFIASSYGPSSFNFLKKIQERQTLFLKLKGNSYMETKALTGDIGSFIEQFPTAINHTFFRPSFTDNNNFFGTIGAIETYSVILIFTISLFYIRKNNSVLKEPLVLFLISFSLINYLLIGYIVPFSGAVVRYRVVFELFLLISSILIIDKDFTLSNQIRKLLRGIKNSLLQRTN